MMIEIDISGKSSEALDEHIRQRISSSLDQYPERIVGVEVRMEDVNGPRGGVDQRCQIKVKLNPKGDVVVSELAADPYQAASAAADRLRNAVSRAVGKLKEH